MKIFSGAAALFAAMALFAVIAYAHGGNKSDSATQGSSPGGQQSQEQQQGPSAMNHEQSVQQVQQALNDKGYNAGQPDGNWTSTSRDALLQFQKDNGLQPTGEIDQQSLALLGVPAGSGSAAGGQESQQPASTDQQQGSYGQMGNQGGPGGGQTNPQETSP